MNDLIIIGGGPAGISAALYALRANLKTAVIENGPNALAKAHKIDNYYGASLSGTQLYEAGLQQAAALGAQMIHDEVIGVEYTGDFTVTTKNSVYSAPALLLATGTKNQTVKINGLQQLEGKGISYCAVCDGFFFRKKQVAVLGSGAYALHEAEYLSHLAENVTVLTNGEDPDLISHAGFSVITRPVVSVQGTDKLEGITFDDGSQIHPDGLFIALGTADSSDIARKLGAEINGRFIAVQPDFSTNVPGLYAAGDCTGGFLQVAKAVHEGAVAGTAIIKYLRSKK